MVEHLRRAAMKAAKVHDGGGGHNPMLRSEKYGRPLAVRPFAVIAAALGGVAARALTSPLTAEEQSRIQEALQAEVERLQSTPTHIEFGEVKSAETAARGG